MEIQTNPLLKCFASAIGLETENNEEQSKIFILFNHGTCTISVRTCSYYESYDTKWKNPIFSSRLLNILCLIPTYFK